MGQCGIGFQLSAIERKSNSLWAIRKRFYGFLDGYWGIIGRWFLGAGQNY